MSILGVKDKIEKLVEKAIKNKIPMIALFPNTPLSKKNNNGTESLNKNNLVCKALRLIKRNFNEIGLMCDVALDPYTSHGHDGVIANKKIDNDKTIKILIKQALLQAEMGCNVIAPSDMMDGRVGAIRKALDKRNFQDVSILSSLISRSSTQFFHFLHFSIQLYC